MNKLIFTFCASAALFFSSCDSFVEHDVTIENNSTQTVSFKLTNYPDIEKQTLASGASVSLDLYDRPQLEFLNHERVSYESGSSLVSIKDLQSFEYLLVNTSKSESVVISEQNGMMGTSELSYSESVTVGADDEKSIVVYTEYPKFQKRYTDESGNVKYCDVPDFVSITKVVK